MNIKKLFSCILLAFLLIGLSCLETDSLEKILKDFSAATEKLINNVAAADKAGNSKSISRELEKYSSVMEKLITRVKNLESQYNKNQDKEVDFEAVRKDFEKVAKQITTLVMKLAKYITEKEVMDALDKVQEKLREIFQ